MKKLILTLCIALVSFCSYAQNVFPLSGNAGIGITTPDTKLVIQANNSDNLIFFWNILGFKKAYIGTAVAVGQMIPAAAVGDLILRAENQNILFTTDAGTTANMVIGTSGNVGIGTATPDAKLSVAGMIHAKEIKVDIIGWPDYVFEPQYKVLSLDQVKAYIEKNQRLPDMPSEQEVVQNGINLGEIVKLQTKKIEELTLYLIEQQKQIKLLTTTVRKPNQKLSHIKRIYLTLLSLKYAILCSE